MSAAMNGRSPVAPDEDEEVGHPELTLKGAGSVRRWLYNWLLNSEIEGNYFHFIERWIALLIIANLFSLVFEHVPAVYQPYANWFHVFDLVSVGVFTVEYLMRLYLAPEDKEFNHSSLPRLAYARSPFALIDLVAILPFYLAAFIQIDLRMLRALRLLRYFDTFIMFWVVVSVTAVVLESVESIHYVLNLEFIILDTIAVAIFSLEYLLRIYTVVESPNHKHALFGRVKYALTGNAIVDLLAVLPFFLEAFLHHLFDLRFLRVFRLLRLLKLTKYTGST
ncbi:MAG: ion transporter, partial [Betaproteobacteria bacterium]|nr:ion transporter [Betaproteobacteria bacterium]